MPAFNATELAATLLAPLKNRIDWIARLLHSNPFHPNGAELRFEVEILQVQIDAVRAHMRTLAANRRAKPEPETIDDRYQIYCANVPNPVSYDDWLNR